MLKKASTVAAVAAGLMMLGSPAFAMAGEPHEHSLDGWGNHYSFGEVNTYYFEEEGGDTADQFGLVNFGNDSDLLSNINICQTEINVIAIPVLAQNDESLCYNSDNDDNDDNEVEGESHGG